MFLCSDQPIDPDIPARLRAKGVVADYINGYYEGDVTPERIGRLNEPAHRGLARQSGRIAAADARHVFPVVRQIRHLAGLVRCGFCVSWPDSISAACAARSLSSSPPGRWRWAPRYLVIFAFQIYFGYIYVEIGLIVTVFLAGLLPGAWLGNSLSRPGRWVLLATDLLLILLLTAFVLALHLGGDRLPETFFLAFGFAVSFACGCQFPAVLQLGAAATRLRRAPFRPT